MSGKPLSLPLAKDIIVFFPLIDNDDDFIVN